MNADALQASLFAEAVLKLLLRNGVIDPAEVGDVAAEVDKRGERADDPEPYSNAAHVLRCISMDFDPPTPEPSDADLRRRMIRSV